MSGFKNTGLFLYGTTQRGTYLVDQSNINFAVPYRKSMNTFGPNDTDCSSTGIIPHILEDVKSNEATKTTYKICFDGQKLNA